MLAYIGAEGLAGLLIDVLVLVLIVVVLLWLIRLFMGLRP